jgi:hypothetical protein
VPGQAAEHLGAVDVDVRQLAGRHVQQRPGAKRSHGQLDSGLAAIVRDQCRRAVQAADQRLEGAGGLVRAGMGGHHQRIVESEDHGQIR